MRVLSIPKIKDSFVNEDAAKATRTLIAVSDGAGGGGVFADKWSQYLVEHLPDEPIADYHAFDNWIDSIWEPFYKEYEEVASREGGMLLNKFYDEGSFATIVAVWNDGHWISYGDSVAFCYDRKTGRLQHTFDRIVNFNNPPYLVNCKDPTDAKGFTYGQFEITEDSTIFAASDALSHYIIMMYEVSHKEQFADELQEAIDAQTKDSNFIKTAMRMKYLDFVKTLDVLLGLKHKGNFKQHLQKLYKDGLLGYDDYSLVIL
jgi:hypothetical protein